MTMSARKAKRRIMDMMASTEVVWFRWAGPALDRTRVVNELRKSVSTFESLGIRHAILIGHEVKTCNLMTWARWMEAARQMKGERGGTALHVADEQVGNVRVSTVFLGLDHSFTGGRPLWFETMVFVRDYNGDADMERYSTWEEAEAGHAAMVKRHTVNVYKGEAEA